MYAKSTCTTGCLPRCGGWFVVRPLPRTQIGHQFLYGRGVRLCSCTSCCVGMYGVVTAFTLIAGWCSSSSDSGCSLYCAFSLSLSIVLLLLVVVLKSSCRQFFCLCFRLLGSPLSFLLVGGCRSLVLRLTVSGHNMLSLVSHALFPEPTFFDPVVIGLVYFCCSRNCRLLLCLLACMSCCWCLRLLRLLLFRSPVCVLWF